jgi:hypothetical protein
MLKGQILMAEIFAGIIHVLQSKVCMLLQDMLTNISVREHTYDGFIHLFIYVVIYFFFPIPSRIFLEKNSEAVPTGVI